MVPAQSYLQCRSGTSFLVQSREVLIHTVVDLWNCSNGNLVMLVDAVNVSSVYQEV